MSADPLPLTRRPWRLGALELPHRVLLGSMHTGLEAAGASAPGAWSAVPDARALAAFYRERVEGGAALVVTGGLAVDGPGRGGADYAVLTEAAVVDAFAAVTGEVHAAGGLVAAQLFHAGRYALLGGVVGASGEPEEAVAPSPVPWRAARGAVPRELTHAEVLATVEHFADAARAAVRAGFDAVEVMASEGYLLNQFCSPLTNLRDDDWGGDAERRRAFPLAVVRAVRAAVGPDVPVLVRVSGDDLMPGSSTPDDVAALVRALVGTVDEPLADAVSVGVGWHESTVPTVQSSVPHGAWIPVAERVATAVRTSARPDVPVIASNRFTDLRDVEAVLARGTVDAVALARPFLADPAVVAKSLAGRFDLVTTCLGCDQACIDRSLVGERVSCLVNPRAGREVELPLPLLWAGAQPWSGSRGVGSPPVAEQAESAPSKQGNHAWSARNPLGRRGGRGLAVVGGGPAGLAAAVDTARRGHPVTLFEARDVLGGSSSSPHACPARRTTRRRWPGSPLSSTSSAPTSGSGCTRGLKTSSGSTASWLPPASGRDGSTPGPAGCPGRTCRTSSTTRPRCATACPPGAWRSSVGEASASTSRRSSSRSTTNARGPRGSPPGSVCRPSAGSSEGRATSAGPRRRPPGSR
ncbi:hypothetical protein GCM10025864_00630 [Luteimicrobium album]|uniref:NADH:flavin oxidoreductase/NADH oxidase N-terminal domain-containing protein n=1 Tax=Luteimicrobium album TaxID=1054550 RepID=A0ABQ6HX75_9MICO|nr:hypothetical protein GCM10025864_00630 [Luteimicrobium album]